MLIRQRLLSTNPSTIRLARGAAYINLGHVYLEQNQYQEALEAYRRADGQYALSTDILESVRADINIKNVERLEGELDSTLDHFQKLLYVHRMRITHYLSHPRLLYFLSHLYVDMEGLRQSARIVPGII